VTSHCFFSQALFLCPALADEDWCLVFLATLAQGPVYTFVQQWLTMDFCWYLSFSKASMQLCPAMADDGDLAGCFGIRGLERCTL
jgi:hypothetical protein